MGPDDLSDGDIVCRRLALHTFDHSTGEVKHSAFTVSNKPAKAVSVQVKRLMDCGTQAALAQAGRSDFGMGELVVSEIRALGFQVALDPLPDDPAHAVITGLSTRTHCEMLADITDPVKKPDPL